MVLALLVGGTVPTEDKSAVEASKQALQEFLGKVSTILPIQIDALHNGLLRLQGQHDPGFLDSPWESVDVPPDLEEIQGWRIRGYVSEPGVIGSWVGVNPEIIRRLSLYGCMAKHPGGLCVPPA